MDFSEKISRNKFIKGGLTGLAASTSIIPMNVYDLFTFIGDKKLIGPYITFKENIFEKQKTDTIISWASRNKKEEKLSINQTAKDIKTRLEEIPAEEWKISHARISGIKPGTKLEYELEHEEGIINETLTTKPNPKDIDKFSFALLGDTQILTGMHKMLIKTIHKYNPDFIISHGDRTHDGRDLGRNLRCLDAIELISSTKPIFWGNGNHEYNAFLSNNFFPLPGKQQAYQMQWGRIKFTFLDSTRLLQRPYNFKQLKLLENLDNSTTNFLVLHHSMRGSNGTQSSYKIRDIFKDKLENIDAVLSGHEHNSQIHEVDGITYIVSGGGGFPLLDALNKKEYSLKKGARKYHFNLFEVDKYSIKGSTIGYKRDLINEFLLPSKQVN